MSYKKIEWVENKVQLAIKVRAIYFKLWENHIVNGHTNIVGKYYRIRSKFWRNMRYLFSSPAEIKFIRVMGGHVLVIPFFKYPKTSFPFCYVLSLGKVLNSELVKREVRVGKHWIDFGNDIYRGIEVDGKGYHTDIVKQQERDDYFKKYGWQVIHIDPSDLYKKPVEVRNRVTKFLTR